MKPSRNLFLALPRCHRPIAGRPGGHVRHQRHHRRFRRHQWQVRMTGGRPIIGPTGPVAANDAGTAATVTWQGTCQRERAGVFCRFGCWPELHRPPGATGQHRHLHPEHCPQRQSRRHWCPDWRGGQRDHRQFRRHREVDSPCCQLCRRAWNGTLTINNGINLNAQTMNFRGGNVVINGLVSGTGASKIDFGGTALGFTRFRYRDTDTCQHGQHLRRAHQC